MFVPSCTVYSKYNYIVLDTTAIALALVRFLFKYYSKVFHVE